MKRSRSELYSPAVAEYPARHSPDRVTEGMNEALEEIVDTDIFARTLGQRALVGTVICVPLTSNLMWGAAPGNVILPPAQTGLPRESVANVSQIVTLDKSDLSDRTGRLPIQKLELLLAGVDLVRDGKSRASRPWRRASLPFCPICGRDHDPNALPSWRHGGDRERRRPSHLRRLSARQTGQCSSCNLPCWPSYWCR